MKKFMLILLAAGAMTACKNSSQLSKVPAVPEKNLYIDVHDLGPGNVTAAAVAEAHEKDLEIQDAFDVNFMKYWVDESAGKVYCLSESPSEEHVIRTHREAHGLIPDKVHKVSEGEEAEIKNNSNLFLDIHFLGEGNVTPEAVAEAHEHDLRTQGKYHVNFINYWLAEEEGVVYCLSEAAKRDDVIKTHTEAHGLVPDQVLEITQGE